MILYDRDRDLMTGLCVQKHKEWRHGVQQPTVIRIVKDDESQAVLLELSPAHAVEIAIRILQNLGVEYHAERDTQKGER